MKNAAIYHNHTPDVINRRRRGREGERKGERKGEREEDIST